MPQTPFCSLETWQSDSTSSPMAGFLGQCCMRRTARRVYSHWDVSQQAVKLYQEEGQFNPHAARSQRKQAKKGQRRQVSLATRKAAEEEYDFAEAFDNVAVGLDEE